MAAQATAAIRKAQNAPDAPAAPAALCGAARHRLAGHALRPADLAGEKLLVNVAQCSFRTAADHVLGPEVERLDAGGVPEVRELLYAAGALPRTAPRTTP
ncbi:hypothetical protein ACFV2X_29570 [Streptomyces sp. NPDC059679]|uniref:hypothetical protein n=1 Tax=Streptomyces sp. NPDC059679 TaxID=3346903 RepID=UPI0036AFD02E